MASSNSPASPSHSSQSPTPTPGGDPTHSTYEVNVPVRNGRTSSPQAERPSIRIPKIQPVHNSGNPPPAELAAGLEGKFVDEFGNVLDWDGTVLARVEGDLPSMVGRPVSASGEILDTDGEVAGYICEAYPKSEPKPELKSLSGGLKVDDDGNIYDDAGNVIGKLNKPQASSPRDGQADGRSNEVGPGVQAGNRVPPKSPAAPRPDEMYLDVKSTFDGIQLIIKIPTIFNNNSYNKDKDNVSNDGNGKCKCHRNKRSSSRSTNNSKEEDDDDSSDNDGDNDGNVSNSNS